MREIMPGCLRHSVPLGSCGGERLAGNRKYIWPGALAGRMAIENNAALTAVIICVLLAHCVFAGDARKPAASYEIAQWDQSLYKAFGGNETAITQSASANGTNSAAKAAERSQAAMIATNNPSRQFTEMHADTIVEMNCGEGFEVILDGNPASGYMWEQVSGDPAIIKPAHDREFSPYRKIWMSGGNNIFHYVALLPGETQLKLVFRRSLEMDEPPAKTFNLRVIVK